MTFVTAINILAAAAVANVVLLTIVATLLVIGIIRK